MDALNTLLHAVADCALPILVEATLERLAALCAHQRSVFVRSNAFPAAKLAVAPGTERECLAAAGVQMFLFGLAGGC